MIVDSIKSTGLGNGNSSSEKPDAMGQDTFLTLLVTQLQNQDPLNPLEGSEFAAQLAQFSSLEKLNMINDNIKSLHLYQSSMNNSQTVGFIGKKITASGNSIYLDQDMGKEIKFELESEAKTVFINIYSSDSRIIKTIETDKMHAGIQGVEWDGTDNNNNKIPEGEYTFEVQAVDLNGGPVQTATFVSGRVSGVQFKDGVANLVVDNQQVPIGKVIEVAEN
jgi:flagellar basal-body rod modification protein FlgD